MKSLQPMRSPMPKQSERTYGSMPEWAANGPIDSKNYAFRAERHCRDKSSQRQGAHPVITRESKEFPLWEQFFDGWLGGRPLSFEMLVDATIKEMTVPEQVPQWFDPSFVPR